MWRQRRRGVGDHSLRDAPGGGEGAQLRQGDRREIKRVGRFELLERLEPSGKQVGVVQIVPAVQDVQPKESVIHEPVGY